MVAQLYYCVTAAVNELDDCVILDLRMGRDTATTSYSTRQLWKKPADALHIVSVLIPEALNEIFLFGLRPQRQQRKDDGCKERDQPGSQRKAEAQPNSA